jgi:hypothetical protein
MHCFFGAFPALKRALGRHGLRSRHKDFIDAAKNGNVTARLWFVGDDSTNL